MLSHSLNHLPGTCNIFSGDGCEDFLGFCHWLWNFILCPALSYLLGVIGSGTTVTWSAASVEEYDAPHAEFVQFSLPTFSKGIFLFSLGEEWKPSYLDQKDSPGVKALVLHMANTGLISVTTYCSLSPVRNKPRARNEPWVILDVATKQNTSQAASILEASGEGSCRFGVGMWADCSV